MHCDIVEQLPAIAMALLTSFWKSKCCLIFYFSPRSVIQLLDICIQLYLLLTEHSCMATSVGLLWLTTSNCGELLLMV